MDDKTRRTMRLASTQWFQRINYRNFTVYLTTADTLPQIVNRLLQYNSPIGLKFRKGKIRTLDSHMRHVSRLTNLVSLAFLDIAVEGSPNPITWAKLTTLTNLTDLYISNAQYLPSTMAALVNLSSIAIAKTEMVAALAARGPFKMTNLAHLTLTAECAPLDIFAMLPCPSRLTELRTHGQLDHSHVTRLYNLRQLSYTDNFPNGPFRIELDKFTALNELSLGMAAVSMTTFPSTLTALSLDCQRIEPRSMEAMARLHGLKYLKIDSVTNTDDDLAWLSTLSRLETFCLWPSYNGVPSVFQGEVFGHLNPLKLTQLELLVYGAMTLKHATRLTGLLKLFIYEDDDAKGCDYSFVSALTRLTSVDLMCEGDNPSLAALGHLERLKSLKVTPSFSIDPPRFPAISLARMTNLERLDMEECSTVTLESLKGLTHLTHLTYSSVAQVDRAVNYDFLADLPLQRFDCGADTDMTDGFGHALAKLTGLHNLVVRRLTAEQVANLSSLQCLTTLMLMYSSTGTDGEHLPVLTALQHLQVIGCFGFTKDRSEAVARKLPNLVELVVY